MPDVDPGSILVGDGLVEVCPVPRRDPDTLVRPPSGSEGHDSGLQAGEVVGEHYEVVGLLTSGGMGKVYLARDLNLPGTHRVLKGLLDATNPEATRMAIDERQFLAAMEQRNIVKIITFVTRGGSGFIVMEYLDGVSLAELQSGSGLPSAEAVGYILDVLPALGYLHGKGLVHCDFKPDNVMKTNHGPVLIDLGAVRRLDEDADEDRVLYGTVGFVAPEVADGEVPSIASDLYSVGRTLAVLCADFEPRAPAFRDQIPGPAESTAFANSDALYRFLLRATAPHPGDRFQSAADMADQLGGVLRELLAERDGVARPRTSTHFTADLRAEPGQPDWQLLPRLRVAADDPAAGSLATLAGTDPDVVLDALRADPERTMETRLREAMVLIDHRRTNEAVEVLDGIESEQPGGWKTSWYRGLAALVQGDADRARASFEIVYRSLSGELAPKIALGIAHETLGEPLAAVGWYDTVSRTDPSYTTATFGLARCREALGDRTGALTAYERVPESSSSYLDAQVGKVRLLLRPAETDAGPERRVDELQAAGSTIAGLALDGELRARLSAEVLEAALAELMTTTVEPDPNLVILRCPMTEAGVRLGLERNYRLLARYAPSPDERIRYVDLANDRRPRTLT